MNGQTSWIDRQVPLEVLKRKRTHVNMATILETPVMTTKHSLANSSAPRSKKNTIVVLEEAKIPAQPASGGKKARNREAHTCTEPTLLCDRLTSDLVSRGALERSGLEPIHILGRLLRDSASVQQMSKVNLEGSITTTAVLATTSITAHEKVQLAVSNEQIAATTISTTSIAPPHEKKPKADGQTFTLDDFAALFALNTLIVQYGRISHMGILDPSYSFFMSRDRKSALYYKVKDKIAVVGGNPLCAPESYGFLISEFAVFRKKHKLGIAYLGATDTFAQYAREQKGWVSMRFGCERALNPVTNPILAEREGKRIVRQNKQLLDPKRGNVHVSMYVPSQAQDLVLQQQLMEVYETWRDNRSHNGRPQAYMTVFDPFALPHLMIYLYTVDASDPSAKPHGFAALRRLSSGYHIDPYCALPTAPRGVTDLLIFSAMALLNRAGVPYLGLGFEPSTGLTNIHGMGDSMIRLTQSCYRRTFSHLPLSGKRTFHDKWRPDDDLEAGLYIIYPDGVPNLKHSLATLHFANISARLIFKAEIKGPLTRFHAKIGNLKPATTSEKGLAKAKESDQSDGARGEVDSETENRLQLRI